MTTETATENRVDSGLLRLHLNGPFLLDKLIDLQAAVGVLALFIAFNDDSSFKRRQIERKYRISVGEVLTALADSSRIELDAPAEDQIGLTNGAIERLFEYREKLYLDFLKERYPTLEQLVGWLLGREYPKLGSFDAVANRSGAALAVKEHRRSITVVRMSFGSPGSIDFAGLGSAIGHLKDFLLRVIELYVDRDKRQAEVEGVRLENQSKQIDLVMKRIDAYRQMGYSEDDCRLIALEIGPAYRVLAQLVEEKQITGARVIKD